MICFEGDFLVDLDSQVVTMKDEEGKDRQSLHLSLDYQRNDCEELSRKYKLKTKY